MTEQRTEDDLCIRLREVCTCMRAPEEPEDPKCLFCEARERIEVQDRCLRLAQADLARWHRLYEAAVKGRAEMRQAVREARQDARDAAAEATWKERQGDEYGSY